MSRIVSADLAVLAAFLLCAAGVGVTGYRLANSIAEKRLVAVERDHARAAFAQADANSVALAEALDRGNALTRQLQAARREAARLKQDRQHEIASTTDGRVCLREPALRVLEHADGLAVDLPPAAGGADRADAGHAATDTDVARWALDAGAQYAECARRLDALIRWHNPEGAR